MYFLTFILLSIVVGYPIWDHFYMKKGDFSNKRKMYLTIMIPQWMIIAILFIYWLVTNRSWSQLFFNHEPILSAQLDQLKMFGLGVIFSLSIYIILFIFSKKLRQKLATFFNDQTENIHFMLPVTVEERILFGLVSLTAGVCEEIIFRGVMLYYFENMPFHFSTVALIIGISLLFGIVHLYQGWKGVLSTAYLGGIFLYIYLVTGNLWISITIHFLVDVKFAFTSNKNNPAVAQN